MATTSRTGLQSTEDRSDESGGKLLDNDDVDELDPWAGFTEEERRRGWKVLTLEEGQIQFDAAVRRRMGISGEEFIRRWDAGEYAEIADTEGHRHIMNLAGLIGFARKDH